MSTDNVTPLQPVERNLIARALRRIADSQPSPLLESHRKLARELADRIEDAGGVLLTDSEGPY